MEFDRLDVVEHGEEVRLDGVRVRGLTQDLEQRRVRHEEKPREQQPLLLQVSVEQSIYFFTASWIVRNSERSGIESLLIAENLAVW